MNATDDKESLCDRASYSSIASDENNRDGLSLQLIGIPKVVVGEEAKDDDDDGWDSGDGITIDDAIERLKFGKFQRLILTAAGLCFASDAMQVIALSFLTNILRSSWDLSNAMAASITSVLFAGAMVGTLVLGPLSDAVGRRSIFLWAATIISGFGFGTALAPNYAFLLFMLFGVGIGVGGLTVPFDVLAEFLPNERRGTHLLFIEYFWTAGCLYVVGIAFCFLQNNHWRIFMSLCALPCVVSLVVGYLFVPESPRWLASKGRLDEALKILKHAASMNGQEIDFVFPAQVRILPEPEAKHASLSDLLQPKWRWIVLRLWGAWFAFAFGYYGTIMAITRVFESSSSNGSNTKSTDNFDYGAIFVSSLAEIIGTTLVILLVDRVGRIPTQVVSYACAGIFVFLLCTMAETSNRKPESVLVVLGFCARVFEMAGTCVSWVSTAEILTTDLRGTGHSTANAIGRIGAFFCPFFVVGDVPLVKVGTAMLIVHSFTVFCVWKLPETKGRGMGVEVDADIAQLENEDDDLFLNDNHPTNGEVI